MSDITKYILLFIFLQISNFIFCENATQKSQIYHSVDFNEKNKSEDLIILNEKNTIEITDVKAIFIKYYFYKEIKYKILTSAGIERLSRITLPEVFDPTDISHFPKFRNHTTAYSDMKCKYFKVLITDKNNLKKEAKVKLKQENIQMFMTYNKLYGNYYKNNYYIENLEIGDEVSMEYCYEVPYNDNWASLSSFRIYFNGDIPKEKYQLILSCNSMLDIKFAFGNKADPDSIIEKKNKKMYYWNKNNLYGCIKEKGARPYLSLPYIVFSVQPPELKYTIPNTFDNTYIPFYALFSNMREKRSFAIALSIYQGVTSNEFISLKKYVANEILDLKNDSLGYDQLMKIHNTIVEEFKYNNDTNYFKRVDTKDPNIGNDLNSKTIRDLNRYDIYVALILKLGLSYYTAYVCDIRTGEINDEYFAPMYYGDYLFAVLLKNNIVQFLYPKSSQFGYYLNEMPFYFENVKARIVCLNDYMPYKSPISEKFRTLQFPGSKINENTRKSNILVNVNLDSLSLGFNANVSLSGQYSTLTRGLYQNNYKDESVNNYYHKKIWELNDQIKVISQVTKMTNKEFPFQAVVNAKYKAYNLLTKKNDTLYLNMTNWFNHIIYDDFDINKRQMDFYPDFYGNDTYIYFLQFDKSIKLVNLNDQIEIKNEFGEFKFLIEQINENTIKVSSYFATISDKVSVDKIQNVKDIFDKIHSINKSYLAFTLN